MLLLHEKGNWAHQVNLSKVSKSNSSEQLMTNDTTEQVNMIPLGYLALLPIDKKAITVWDRRMNLTNQLARFELGIRARLLISNIISTSNDGRKLRCSLYLNFSQNIVKCNIKIIPILHICKLFRIDRYTITGHRVWKFQMVLNASIWILTEYDEIGQSSISRLFSRSIGTRRTELGVHAWIESSIANLHVCYPHIVGFVVWVFDLISVPVRMSCEEILIADQLRCRTWCPFPPLDPSIGSRLWGTVEGRIVSCVHCSVDGPCLENP